MNPPQQPKPPVLEYHCGQDEFDRSATLFLRIVAVIFCLIFAVWPGYQWFLTERPADQAYLPSIAVSVAGALFCMLIAIGVSGKQKRKAN